MKNKYILLVESGATKTSWAAVKAVSGDDAGAGDASGAGAGTGNGAGDVVRVTTAGINASVMSAENVLSIVLGAEEQLGKIAGGVADIRFYGAGLVSDESVILIDKVLKNVFPAASVAYGSDLLAAAKASFGSGEGVVAILGTGSNSGLYDGIKIVKNVLPGGFIIGDEGSGCAVGKAFLSDWVKGLLPEDIAKRFALEHNLTYAELVENVYRGTKPSAYIAAFTWFVLSCKGTPYADGLLERNLRDFIERSLMQYDLKRYQVAFVGSMADECANELKALAAEYGFVIKGFVRTPMDELIKNVQEEFNKNV